MVSIARSSLLFEWRRYTTAVLAVTFAGLLVVIQLALLLGLFGSVSTAIDRSSAQLWIGFKDTQSVDLGRPIRPASASAAWAHAGVARIERFASVYADLRRPDGVAVGVVINAIDTAPEAMAFSKLLSRAGRQLLLEPGAIVIDAADLGKLGALIGTVVEINGRRARVAGAVEGLRAVGGVNVLASFATARSLDPSTAEQVTFFLVGLKPGHDARQVAHDIGDQGRYASYSVWLAKELSVRSQSYWLLESGAGIGSGFASLLAVMVGIVITSQTLSGAILASIKEFAALRALGVARQSLRAAVIEQSLWVGVIGLAMTGTLAFLIAWLADHWRIAMVFPLWMLGGVAAVMMAIAVSSGLLSLRPLMSAEPASLLR